MESLELSAFKKGNLETNGINDLFNFRHVHFYFDRFLLQHEIEFHIKSLKVFGGGDDVSISY